MKIALPWILLTLALVYIGWQCNHVPAPLLDVKKVDSLNTAIKSRDVKYTIDSLAWEEKAKAQDSIINLLSKSKAAQREAFTSQIVQLTFQKNKYRTAAEGKDTVSAMIACAEYMRLADSFYVKAVKYEITIDSLLAAHEAAHVSDSAMIRAVMSDREEGRRQISALQKLLMDAVHDNNDLRMALSRSKKGRWILAALFGAAGGFIGHQIK